MRVALTLAVAVLLVPVLATAGSIYKWVDERGDVHITDRIDDVPEPYHGMYVAAEKRRQEAAEKQAAAAKAAGKRIPTPKAATKTPRPRRRVPSRSGYLAKEEAARQKWKNLVGHWRVELAAATEALERLDAEIAVARQNPILRHTPQVKKKVAEIQERRPGAVGRVNHARKMLLVEIPKRARREQVPPKWLL